MTVVLTKREQKRIWNQLGPIAHDWSDARKRAWLDTLDQAKENGRRMEEAFLRLSGTGLVPTVEEVTREAGLGGKR